MISLLSVPNFTENTIAAVGGQAIKWFNAVLAAEQTFVHSAWMIYVFDRMVGNKPIGRNGVVERQVEEKSERRNLILNAARTIFAEKGYAETSMADIGHGARLGKATLYYYFPTKEALYQAVYLEGSEAFYTQMIPVLEAEEPHKVIKRMLSFYVEYMNEHPHFLKIFFPLGRSAPTEIISRDAIQDLQKRHLARLDQILREKLHILNPAKRDITIQILWSYLMGLNYKLVRNAPLQMLLTEIETVNTFMLQNLQE